MRVHGATRRRFSAGGDVTVLTNLIESVFSRVLCLGLQTNQELNSAGVEFPLLVCTRNMFPNLLVDLLQIDFGFHGL